MKIKTRNRFITFLMILSLGMLLFNGVYFGFSLYQHTFSFPTNINFVHMQDFFLSKFNYIAVLSSIFAILVFIFVSLTYIDVEFEKTQSTEIIYYSLFLFGFLFEFVRLMFPYFNLWDNVGRFSVMISRVLIFGRTLAPISLLFAVIYSNFESRQYVEQNVLILIAVAIFFAISVPLNCNVIKPTGYIVFGFGNLIHTLQVILLTVAVFALIIKSVQSHYSKQLVFGFALITIGYILLIEGNCILTASLGTFTLFTGSFMYLKNLHGQYLWN